MKGMGQRHMWILRGKIEVLGILQICPNTNLN